MSAPATTVMAPQPPPIRPLIKVCVMGIAGSGKTHFAATFPKPMLVLQCDSDGKEGPYVERGIVLAAPTYGDLAQPVTRVMSLKAPDRELIRIERFADRSYAEPDGFARLMSRIEIAAREAEAGQWATIVLDGYSLAHFLAKEMRARGPFIAPFDTKKGEHKVDAFATTDIERLVNGWLTASLQCNVVLPCHVDEDRDETAGGTQLRNPKAPGRMRQGTPAAFPEVYRVYTVPQPDGSLAYQLQTKQDGQFNCFSQKLNAPNPCYPSYESLWTNWEQRETAKRQQIAALTKGEATT